MVPALFVNKQYIGGFSQLKNMYEADSPDDLATAYTAWNTAVITCVNDDSVSDSYNDTCSNWYTGSNLEFCGDYDTVDFVAAQACCECA